MVPTSCIPSISLSVAMRREIGCLPLTCMRRVTVCLPALLFDLQALIIGHIHRFVMTFEGAVPVEPHMVDRKMKPGAFDEDGA